MTHGTCRHKENIGFQAGYLDLQQIFSSKGKMEFGFFWNRFAWVPVTPENKNTEVCLCGCCSDISCETWNHCVGSLVQGCFRDLSASKNQSSESLYGHRECPFEFDMIVPHTVCLNVITAPVCLFLVPYHIVMFSVLLFSSSYVLPMVLCQTKVLTLPQVKLCVCECASNFVTTSFSHKSLGRQIRGSSQN